MNSAALASYGPRKQPELAFGLAVAVHLLLAALLFWGFHWEKPTPQPIQLEIWSAASQPQPSAPKIETPPPVKTAEPVVEDIQPAEINRKKPVEPPKEVEKPKPPVEKPVEKPAEKPTTKPVETKPAKPSPTTSTKTDSLEDLISAVNKGESKQTSADKAQLKKDYVESLVQLYTGKAFIHPDLNGNPKVEFTITILANMTYNTIIKSKPSGDPLWDTAAENAIRMTKLPPLPQGLPFSNDVRVLIINLCPKANLKC